MGEPEYAVVFDNLSLSFGENRRVLDSVDLKVQAGEIVGIIGPSGCGKTMLCLCANGVIPQVVDARVEGSAQVFGMDTKHTPLSGISGRVGTVFQNPETQLVTTTVEDEIVLMMEHLGVDVDDIEGRLEATLRLCSLNHLRSRPFNRLSGGQKQMAAIAAVLAGDPPVLLFDNPTSDLDPHNTGEVFDLIRKVTVAGRKTTIVVDHKIEELVGLCNRLVLLKAGSKVFDGPTRTVLQQTQLLRAAGVRPLQVTELYEVLRDSLPDSAELRAASEAPTSVEEAATLFKRWLDPAVLARRPAPGSPARTLGDEALAFRDITHVYPNGFRALKGISESVKRGELVAIIGQNGSGKTTLAHILMGMLRPSGGDVTVNGESTAKVPVSLLAKKIGFLFQNPDHQLFLPTVREEIEYGPRNVGMDQATVERNAGEAIEFVGLDSYVDRDPFELSSGERQRVAVASVLAMRPEVFILDEPTTGQDYRSLSALMAMVRELNGQGKTVVMITHDMSLVADHAERVLVMAEGQIIASGTPGEIFTNREVMARAGIAPPPLVQLLEAMSVDPVPRDLLTVEALAQAMRAAMRVRLGGTAQT